MRQNEIKIGHVYEGRAKLVGRISRRRVLLIDEYGEKSIRMVEWHHISGKLAVSAYTYITMSGFCVWADRDVTESHLNHKPSYLSQVHQNAC